MTLFDKYLTWSSLLYTNFLANVDLVNVNFTNTTFQKVPIPHLARPIKFAYDIRLLLTLIKHFFSRTKCSVKQGVGVIYLHHILVTVLLLTTLSASSCVERSAKLMHDGNFCNKYIDPHMIHPPKCILG